MSKSQYAKAIAFTILLIGAFFIGQYFSLAPRQADSEKAILDTSAAEEVWDIIQTSFLREDEVDSAEVKYGLAKGLMGILKDPHSAFMDPNESEAFMSSLKGDLQGIGAELKLEDGFVVVVSPLPESPAEKAGLLPGDVIMKVDGEVLGTITNLIDVVLKIRGPKGSPVTLSVLHEGQVVPVDITIIRDEIHLDAVKYKKMEANGKEVGILTVSSFTETIGQEFEDSLMEAVRDGVGQLVIDLRFNGGGFLDGAIDLVSYFMDSGEVVVVTRSKSNEEVRVSTQKRVQYKGKVAILVNDSSASASEIVTGALQDYGIAKVFGVKTFGKGSVQEVRPLRDGSLVRITIAEWLTPKKRSIEGVGLVPDEIIELDYPAFREGDDNQLQAAMEYLTSQ